MNRRDLFRSAAALAAAGLPVSPLLAAATAKGVALMPLGKKESFDYAGLKGRARVMAMRPYIAPSTKLPDKVAALDWDQYQSISTRDDHALWSDAPDRFQIKFFHLGLFFKSPVRMHEVVDGRAQELAYDPEMFNYGKSGLNKAHLPKDLGFAGFRLNFHTHWKDDVAAFLGASYFRAVGGEGQYGLSARGLAIDTGAEKPEEFPMFTDYWFEKPAKGSTTLTVYALMDSPSVAGAYRFDIHPGDTLTMDIDAALYPRQAIDRVGIAPLTSMYQHGENDARMANDWRPEIHDSDGLCMWSGAGEWIWRPVSNPVGLRYSSFSDENPRGFGLLQRDRDFDHYQDDGVFYEKRPCLWVQPKAGWGAGGVDLVELPTDDETNDNIVAYWNPAQKFVAGEERLFSYRLYWGAEPPVQSPAAQVVATRTGIGGVVGKKRPYFARRFAVDFAGGDLAMLKARLDLEPVITTSRGEILIPSVRPLHSIKGYRVMFDLKPTDDSVAPIELRLFLRLDGQPLSETWTYQYTPPPLDQRKFG